MALPHYPMGAEKAIQYFSNVLNDYENFTPFPNPDPTKYAHCGKLCDYKDACRIRQGFGQSIREDFSEATG